MTSLEEEVSRRRTSVAKILSRKHACPVWVKPRNQSSRANWGGGEGGEKMSSGIWLEDRHGEPHRPQARHLSFILCEIN